MIAGGMGANMQKHGINDADRGVRGREEIAMHVSSFALAELGRVVALALAHPFASLFPERGIVVWKPRQSTGRSQLN